MIRWKGRVKVTQEQYDVIRALYAHRQGQRDRYSQDTLAAYAREVGLPKKTVYSAARHGIKRYDHAQP